MVSSSKTLKMLTICIATSSLNDIFSKGECCAKKDDSKKTEVIHEYIKVPVEKRVEVPVEKIVEVEKKIEVPVFNKEYAISINNNMNSIQTYNLISAIYELIGCLTGSQVKEAVTDESFSDLYYRRINGINESINASELKFILENIKSEEDILLKYANDSNNQYTTLNLNTIENNLTEKNKTILEILLSTLEKYTLKVFKNFFTADLITKTKGDKIEIKSKIYELNDYESECFKFIFNYISLIGNEDKRDLKSQQKEMFILADIIAAMATFNNLTRVNTKEKIEINSKGNYSIIEKNIAQLDKFNRHSLECLSNVLESIKDYHNRTSDNNKINIGNTCINVINGLILGFIEKIQQKLTSKLCYLSNSISEDLILPNCVVNKNKIKLLTLTEKINLGSKGTNPKLILNIIGDNFEIVKEIYSYIQSNDVNFFNTISQELASISNPEDINIIVPLRKLHSLNKTLKLHNINSLLMDILSKYVFNLNIKIDNKTNRECKFFYQAIEKNAIPKNISIEIKYYNNTKFNNISAEC